MVRLTATGQHARPKPRSFGPRFPLSLSYLVRLRREPALYDEEGRLNYVGRTRIYEDAGGDRAPARAAGRRRRLHRPRPGRQEPLVGQGAGAGAAEARLVVEINADHITSEHMHHGARLLRWRTDKRPESCMMD